MKKMICFALITVLTLGCLAGCGNSGSSSSSKAEEITEAPTTEPSYEGLEFVDSPDYSGYRCIVKNDAPATVYIPAEYQGRKVDELTSDENGCANLKELITFGDLEGIKTGSFQNCPLLESVTLNGTTEYIEEASFNNCPELQSFVINGMLEKIYGVSFENCPKLKRIVVPEGSQINNECRENGLVIGTDEYSEMCGTMKVSEALKQARGVLGTKFDESKKIKSDDASKYKDQLNGLVISTDRCANCEPGAYNESKVPSDVNLKVEDPLKISELYSDTLVTDEKTEAIKEGKSPVVYALVEASGMTEFMYSFGAYYKISYRVSFWDESSGELLAWFDLKDIGEAPDSFNFSDLYKVTFVLDGDSKHYFCDSDGNKLTPLFVIEQYVYGKTKSVQE